MALAAVGTETQFPLFSGESISGEGRGEKGEGFLEPVEPLVLYPCHRPALSWMASIFGHDHKLISRTFAG